MASLNKFIDAFRILIHSAGGVKYLLSRGASVSSFFVVFLMKHYISQLNTIIDAGANKGQFAIAANRFFPSARIYSFEPVPDVFEQLKLNTGHIKEIFPINLALGSDDGKLTFYINSYSPASSPLIVSESQIIHFPKTALQQETLLSVKKLDSIVLPFNLIPSILLKLDVQGYEKEVLCGAKNMLKKIDYILLETSFIPMYKEEPMFEEIIYFVNSLNFHVIAPVGILTGINDQILQMDILFKNNRVAK